MSENTVAGLMREQGLAARRKKRRKATTRPGSACAPAVTWQLSKKRDGTIS